MHNFYTICCQWKNNGKRDPIVNPLYFPSNIKNRCKFQKQSVKNTHKSQIDICSFSQNSLLINCSVCPSIFSPSKLCSITSIIPKSIIFLTSYTTYNGIDVQLLAHQLCILQSVSHINFIRSTLAFHAHWSFSTLQAIHI